MAVATVLAVCSLAVTTGGLVYARRSAASARASERSARQVAQIEHAREHDRLTPQLDVMHEADGFERHRITIKLRGATGLGSFDRVTVTILNTRTPEPNRFGRSQLAIDRNIWGPWRFNTQIDGPDSLGRMWRQVPFGREDEAVLSVIPTMPARGWPTADSSTARWRQGYAGAPLRLRIELERDGYDPWTLHQEVALPPLDS